MASNSFFELYGTTDLIAPEVDEQWPSGLNRIWNCKHIDIHGNHGGVKNDIDAVAFTWV